MNASSHVEMAVDKLLLVRKKYFQMFLLQQHIFYQSWPKDLCLFYIDCSIRQDSSDRKVLELVHLCLVPHRLKHSVQVLMMTTRNDNLFLHTPL